MSKKRIAINTGGGDAPGLNAVIRAATLAALNRGWDVVGISDGYLGILEPDRYPEGGLIPLTRDRVRGIAHLGGTIIGTTNRGNPLAYPMQTDEGEVMVDRSAELVEKLHAAGIEAVIAIGGDGSMAIAHALTRHGLRVIGVPKTIDNDLDETVATFGFDTAVAFATECLGRLHSTAEAHDRVMVIEVMGRYAGWIALEAGVAGSADVILIPEIPFNIQNVADKINQRYARGRHFSIVVVAEGARPADGEMAFQQKGDVKRLGGMGAIVTGQLLPLINQEARTVVLGHLLRGGSPTARDRLLSLRFGAAAVRAIEEGYNNVMVALDPPLVRYVPLEDATRRMKTVPLDCDTLATARDLGISFGDG